MNYVTMRANFQGLLNRTDCPDSLAQTFFQMSIARCQREMRLPFMENELDIDTSAGAVSQIGVPNNWLETIAFIVDLSPSTYNIEVAYLDPGSFARKQNDKAMGGDPDFYTRRGSSFYTCGQIPQGATAYITYYGELVPLMSDTDEPTLALIAPDLIIYGALTYAADYFVDDRGTGWEQKWEAFREQVQSQAAAGENQDDTNAIQPSANYNDTVW